VFLAYSIVSICRRAAQEATAGSAFVLTGTEMLLNFASDNACKSQDYSFPPFKTAKKKSE
jgi:hypothetical protein